MKVTIKNLLKPPEGSAKIFNVLPFISFRWSDKGRDVGIGWLYLVLWVYDYDLS